MSSPSCLPRPACLVISRPVTHDASSAVASTMAAGCVPSPGRHVDEGIPKSLQCHMDLAKLMVRGDMTMNSLPSGQAQSGVQPQSRAVATARCSSARHCLLHSAAAAPAA